MALQVIGAGFGRTGTESLRQALNALGVGPCHHMHEVFADPHRIEAWHAIVRGGPADWDAIFEGYGATVDWPAAHYWRELAAHYPDAKILLSVRDPEAWYASMQKTIAEIVRQGTLSTDMPADLVREVFDGEVDDRDHMIAVYERNTAEVQAACSPDRLLTYRLGDGWEPLAEFLGVPVPDIPYPHANTTADFRANLGLDEAGAPA